MIENIDPKYDHKISIGIDQSYNYTGITIAIDNKIVRITGVDLHLLKSKTDKRDAIRQKVTDVLELCVKNAAKMGKVDIKVNIERIRLRSTSRSNKRFTNIGYIQSMGAVNAVIIDAAKRFNIPVFSTDTKSWRSQIIGKNASERTSNNYYVDPVKWQTVKYFIDQGYEEQLKDYITDNRAQIYNVDKEGRKFRYNDDRADSAGLALYLFIDPKDLKVELET